MYIKFIDPNGNETVIPFPQGFQRTIPRDTPLQLDGENESRTTKIIDIYALDGTGIHYGIMDWPDVIEKTGENKPKLDPESELATAYTQAFVMNANGKTLEKISFC